MKKYIVIVLLLFALIFAGCIYLNDVNPQGSLQQIGNQTAPRAAEQNETAPQEALVDERNEGPQTQREETP